RRGQDHAAIRSARGLEQLPRVGPRFLALEDPRARERDARGGLGHRANEVVAPVTQLDTEGPRDRVQVAMAVHVPDMDAFAADERGAERWKVARQGGTEGGSGIAHGANDDTTASRKLPRLRRARGRALQGGDVGGAETKRRGDEEADFGARWLLACLRQR